MGSTPQRGHHLRLKFLYGGVAAALALNVLLFTSRHHTPTGYILGFASDTCYCYPFNRIIHLHLSKDAFITIDTEAVQPNQLGNLLAEIYAVRANVRRAISGFIPSVSKAA